MSILDVPGARLYYETCGAGALLVLVPGASGTGDSFKRVTAPLAAHYTVVTYDRRGFSRSQLDGPQDYVHRLDTDADDVGHLLAYLGDQRATVFGSSSGAIVALQALMRHPAAVHTLVPHEPPIVTLLADGQQWLDRFVGLYDLYRQRGVDAAQARFRAQAFAVSDQEAMAHAPQNAYTRANATYWFEHELRQYPAVALDLGALGAYAERIVLVAGKESRGHPTYEATVALGKRLNRPMHEVPGGHVGFLTHPSEFAQALLQTLERSSKARIASASPSRS
jgi:pimeloyl-ACP methyl ester carboxylesterase